MSETACPAPAFDGALRLADWGVIRAQGADAAAFLHSQLTQDIAKLDAAHARLAGYCSPKGRLLATFVAWADADGQILMACSADLLPPTLKRLSMYVLRAKCRLDDASAELPLFGLAGTSARTWLGAAEPAVPWGCTTHRGARVIRLADADGVPRYLVAGGEAPPLPQLPEQAWRWLEVRSGVPRIVAATVEQFVPQMINLELVGGVDFHKGCYPGQEVVARSQYRGAVKRRAYLVDCGAPVVPGAEVFHSADAAQPAGMVVLAAELTDARCSALVELKMVALGGGELRTGGGVRLVPVELPYPLETQAA